MRLVTMLSLALALGLLSSCTVVETNPPPPGPAPDETVTCNNFADFQHACTANCAVTWDCEANYASLDLETQWALDDCSDCLAANLNSGICADCSDQYENSCQGFMESFLGVNCW